MMCGPAEAIFFLQTASPIAFGRGPGLLRGTRQLFRVSAQHLSDCFPILFSGYSPPPIFLHQVFID